MNGLRLMAKAGTALMLFKRFSADSGFGGWPDAATPRLRLHRDDAAITPSRSHFLGMRRHEQLGGKKWKSLNTRTA